MNRTWHIISSLLAILLILVLMGLIVLLIHYAIYGNPIKDGEHIINGIKEVWHE